MAILYALLHHHHYTCNVSVHSAGSCACYVLYLAKDVPLTWTNSSFIPISLILLLKLLQLIKLQLIIIHCIYRELHKTCIRTCWNLVWSVAVLTHLPQGLAYCSEMLFCSPCLLRVVIGITKAFLFFLFFPLSSTRHFCQENYLSLDVLILYKLCSLLCVKNPWDQWFLKF